MDANSIQETKEAERRTRQSNLQETIHQTFASLAEFGGDGTVVKFLDNLIANLTGTEPSKIGTPLRGRIHAIRQVRILTGFSLVDSKIVVERLQKLITPETPKQSAELVHYKEKCDELQKRDQYQGDTLEKLSSEYGELESKNYRLMKEVEALKALVRVYMNRSDFD